MWYSSNTYVDLDLDVSMIFQFCLCVLDTLEAYYAVDSYMWPSWSPGVATSTQKNRMWWIPAEILIIDVSVFLAVPIRYSLGQGSTMSWSHWGRWYCGKKNRSQPKQPQIMLRSSSHWGCTTSQIPGLRGSAYRPISFWNTSSFREWPPIHQRYASQEKQPWVPYSGLLNLKGFSRAGSRLSVPPVLSHGCYAAFEVLQGLDPQDQQDQGENQGIFQGKTQCCFGMVQATKMSR